MNSTGLLSKYQEQNTEIIRKNIKLNERIAILESVIHELQRDNLQLRINSAAKERKTKNKGTNNTVKKKPTNPTKRKNHQMIEQVEEPSSKRRSCSSRPINYVLPSTKSKLRKGDPFTFGNEIVVDSSNSHHRKRRNSSGLKDNSINNHRNHHRRKSPSVSSSNDEDDVKEEDSSYHYHHKRRNSGTVSYVLPSTKCKLRKGDPFTFGNEV